MRYIKKQNTNTSIFNGKGIIMDANYLVTVDSESALLLPKGATGARPATSVEGMMRYNTTTQNFEAYEANPSVGTPSWKRFRTDEPKLIHAQNLGNGDNFERLFGPLDANDATTPTPSAPAQVLCMIENVLQIPTTNYIFIQNPCYYSSNQISFFADISTSGKAGAGTFAGGISAMFSNNSSVVDFADAGFYLGQTIFVSGSTNNNGFYTVASVSATFLSINEAFINENDPGYGTVMTIEGLVNQSIRSGSFSQTQDSTADTITLVPTPGSFDEDEINEDDMIIFDTTTGNIVAGTTYFINTVSNDSSNQITIKATLTGGTFDLVDASTPGNYVLGRGYGRQSSNSSTATATFGGTLTTTAASGNGTTATLSFATQTLAPFYVGQNITVTGVTPVGYNGTFTVTACNTTSVSYLNATTGAQTVAGTVNFATTGASGTGATATITFDTLTYAPFYLGQTITVAGVTPAGYNGSHVVTACTTTSVSFASAATGAQTVPGTVTCVSTIQLANTAGMAAGQEIGFTGTNFGNLVNGTQYYIKQIVDSTHLTISATFGGSVFTLTRDVGYMLVSTLGNNLYVYFGTPVPAGKPVTILHNFDK
jgi:hypothetical protein